MVRPSKKYTQYSSNAERLLWPHTADTHTHTHGEENARTHRRKAFDCAIFETHKQTVEFRSRSRERCDRAASNQTHRLTLTQRQRTRVALAERKRLTHSRIHSESLHASSNRVYLLQGIGRPHICRGLPFFPMQPPTYCSSMV